jgi:hypothetical protein
MKLVRLSLLVTSGIVLSGATARGDPPERPINRLRGVVVTKKDGRPVAGATVALAHARKARLTFDAEGALTAYGESERVLFFLPKRNGETAVDAQTDAQGRFELKRFTAPGDEYQLAVGGPRGAALLKVVPAEYAGRELRIELDEPSYLRVPQRRIGTDGRYSYVAIGLEPDGPRPADAREDEPVSRVHVVLPYGGWGQAPKKEDELIEAGPLPPGHRYRLVVHSSAQELPYWATVLERVVRLPPGQTVDALLKPGEGATLSGCVTGMDERPLANVNVLVKVGEPAELVVGDLTDKHGRYQIAGVPPGQHKLELLRYAIRTAPG